MPNAQVFLLQYNQNKVNPTGDISIAVWTKYAKNIQYIKKFYRRRKYCVDILISRFEYNCRQRQYCVLKKARMHTSMQQYQYKREVRTTQYEVIFRTVTILNTNVWSIRERLQNWCFTGRTTFYMGGPGSEVMHNNEY